MTVGSGESSMDAENFNDGVFAVAGLAGQKIMLRKVACSLSQADLHSCL